MLQVEARELQQARTRGDPRGSFDLVPVSPAFQCNFTYKQHQ